MNDPEEAAVFISRSGRFAARVRPRTPGQDLDELARIARIALDAADREAANPCTLCGHGSESHCFHAHAGGEACCERCPGGVCAGRPDEAEALLDMDGRREALQSVMDAWRAGTLQTVDAPTARDRIEARIKCPMCGEPRTGAPEPWCAAKDNHEEAGDQQHER